MMNKLLCLFAFLVSLHCFADGVLPREQEQEVVWVFSQISRDNVLHNGTGSREREGLESQFSEVTIITSGSTLEVPGICKVESVRHRKEPIDYWWSESTVALYARLFAEEGIPLQEYIHEVTNLWPQQECPRPFDSLIENDGALVTVVGDGYLLVFRPDGTKH